MPRLINLSLEHVRAVMGDRALTGPEIAALLGYSRATNIYDTLAGQYLRLVSTWPKRYVAK